MAHLRNTRTGAVVSVADEKAARLGSEWVPVDPEPDKKPAPARRAAKK